MKIAFVTCSEYRSLTADDRLAIPHLRRRGIEVVPAVWDASDVDWNQFAAVVLRSCWDYHQRPDEFLKFIGRLEGAQVLLCNGYKTVRWNFEKTYLLQLAALGVPIPMTVWLDRESEPSIEHLFEENGWAEAVVKPTVSMSAPQTWILTPDMIRDDTCRIRELLKTSGVMIQEFIPEVRSQGEWQFVFFDRQFSHAILKRPRPGDFRVHSSAGGYVDDEATVPIGLACQAERVLDLIDGPLLYARVDGIDVEGELLLMELELIDPALFLRQEPLASLRFSDSIVKMTSSRLGTGR
jgi:glutathione synthase/RimK-type ligase-like ATP-grasp enzyme